jgi:hypothetical protein
MRVKSAMGNPHPSLLVIRTKMAVRIVRGGRLLGGGLQNAQGWQDERMPHDGVAPYGFAVAMVVTETLKAKAMQVGA